jgi:Ni/Fe-hydrogenase subunit HybB-like protein
MVAALGALTGHADERGLVGLYAPVIAMVFAAITGFLLVSDLKQPWRFHYIFLKPQWRSWLVRGAFVLLAFGAVALVWAIGGLADSEGLVQGLAVPGAILGAGTAGYTAWLFAQCEGRDLWQTPLLLPVLIAQAVTVGAGALLVAGPALDMPDDLRTTVLWCLVGGAAAQLALVAIEITSSGTVHTEMAVAAMVRGAYAPRFRLGVVLGMLAPLALGIVSLAGDTALWGAIGGVLAVIGLYSYEDAFVRAGQAVPLS